MPAVGANARRKEGPAKLCGAAKYIDDYDFPGCLHGATFRSSIPYGKIKSVRFDPKFPWREFVTVTAKDIPGKNSILLLEADQPLLAHKRVTHAMEPIALVAHPVRQKAYEALEHIQVDYEEMDPVLSIEESLAKKQVLYGADNVFKRYEIKRGDARKALKAANVVVEGTYRVPHQEQAYIENNGMAAYVEEDGTLVIMGSMQCPYFVLKAMKPVFRLPEGKIRIVQTTTGGAFGGKEDYPDMLAGHAGLLAMKAKRPVKIIYDRREDMLATTKRHPAVIRHRTGLTRDGRLVAQDIDIVMDGGAYVTLSPVVLSRCILHATGPYECPNARIVARAVATNTPPNGAFRGFGVPQSVYAADLHWEKIAKALHIDSLTLRRRNIIRVGSVMATGQVLRESVSASDVLDKTVRSSGYVRKRKAYARWNRKRSNPTWKGIGLAVVHHGAGFTGNGEVYLASRAGVTLTRDGQVRIDVASTEMGQGSRTSLPQIVADTLGLPYEWITQEEADTSKVPDSGPTVASRTCMIVGGLLRKASLRLKDAVVDAAGSFPKTRPGLRKAARRLLGDEPERRFLAAYEKPAEINFDDKTYKGDAYGVYSYACAVVDLEIDKLTYEVNVRKLYTAHDIGKALNPLMAEGQIIGGVTQGLGYALLENAQYKGGVMQNPQLTDYVIPTFMDTPPMEVDIIENPYSRGPFGAKGLGELPMDVPAPAAAAAVHHATGLWLPDLPILPEKIAKAFHDKTDRK
ncbi:MAG: xanthine dehydrogenase family protein molybdopterin-binding subunit [Elusimicrobiota bacterium]